MSLSMNAMTKRHELPEEHSNPFAGKNRSLKGVNGQGSSYLPMTGVEIAALLEGTSLSPDTGKNFNPDFPDGLPTC